MKNLLIAFGVLGTALSLFGAPQYEINFGYPGRHNGSIRILEDLSSLTLYSDFGSVGNSGKIGYYVYTDTPANAVTGAATFSKSDGAIRLPELRAGDKVGFFLRRANGRVVSRFHFSPGYDGYWLVFDKNHGHGWDEALFFSSIVAEGMPVPTGQPLPGILVTLLGGGAALLICRRQRSARLTA